MQCIGHLGKEWERNENFFFLLTVHAVFVKVVEEIRLLLLVVDRAQHILGVQEVLDDVHQLDGATHLRVGIAGHLFYKKEKISSK